MFKTKKPLLGALLAAITVTSLNTAVAALPGYYLGGQIGLGNTHYGSSDVNSVTSASIDTNNLAGRLFAGYQFNPNWAFELGYTQFSKTKFSKIVPGDISGNIKEYSIDALGKGILPLDNGFGLFGELGAAYVSAKANGALTGSEQRVQPAFGAGASYDVTANIPLFIAWNHTQKMGGNVPSTDLFSLGAAYNFG
jgi:OOP family OmpA-OmpF porin